MDADLSGPVISIAVIGGGARQGDRNGRASRDAQARSAWRKGVALGACRSDADRDVAAGTDGVHDAPPGYVLQRADSRSSPVIPTTSVLLFRDLAYFTFTIAATNQTVDVITTRISSERFRGHRESDAPVQGQWIEYRWFDPNSPNPRHPVIVMLYEGLGLVINPPPTPPSVVCPLKFAGAHKRS